MRDSKTEKDVSVCDIMKNNTSNVLKKLESQTPGLIQKYSDLYMKYLHSIDDTFGTCYISEKEFFDKLNLDQNALNEMKKSSDIATKFFLSQIEFSSKFLESNIQMRISALEAYDNFMHAMIESYAKSLALLNKSNNS